MALGPDEQFLSNDAVGSLTFDLQHSFGFTNVNSALTGSASGLLAFTVGGPTTTYPSALPVFGRITDCQIAVVQAPLSASGFLSGTVDAGVYINGTAALSTRPLLNMLSTSANVSVSAGPVRWATQTGGGVSGVVNQASGAFSAGDVVSYDYNARSVGSAAAGVTGTGLIGYIKYRFGAR